MCGGGGGGGGGVEYFHAPCFVFSEVCRLVRSGIKYMYAQRCRRPEKRYTVKKKEEEEEEKEEKKEKGNIP